MFINDNICIESLCLYVLRTILQFREAIPSSTHSDACHQALTMINIDHLNNKLFLSTTTFIENFCPYVLQTR